MEENALGREVCVQLSVLGRCRSVWFMKKKKISTEHCIGPI